MKPSDSLKLSSSAALLSLTLRALVVCSSLTAVLAGRAELTWPQRELPVNAGQLDQKVYATIPFRNEGNTTVKITAIKPSCDCTAATTAVTEYRPGQEGRIDLEIVPRGGDGDAKRVEVRITSDDRSEDTVIVVVVRKPTAVAISPARVDWKIADEPDEKRVELLFDPALTVFKQVTYPGTAFEVRLVDEDGAGRKAIVIKPAQSKDVAHAVIRIDVVTGGMPRSYIVQASVR